MALATIIAMSNCFEILEAIIAQLVHPDLGAAYLGTQGDIWDAQKDMVAAVFGAIVATALSYGPSRTCERPGLIPGESMW